MPSPGGGRAFKVSPNGLIGSRSNSPSSVQNEPSRGGVKLWEARYMRENAVQQDSLDVNNCIISFVKYRESRKKNKQKPNKGQSTPCCSVH